MDDAAPIRAKKPRTRPRREAGPTTPDPIEIAMEAEAKGVGPSGVAYEVLSKQSALLDADLSHRRMQIAGERMSLVLKWLTGAAGLAAAAAVATMVWQASQARGLVIAPFSVPPELAARGLTGEVVAAQVLDKLTRLQEQTQSARRPDSMGNDWGRDLKVAIPSTGVSVGDVQTALRQWLGRETRVSGEVYRTPAGAVLSVRLAGHPAFQATGDEQNLDALAGQVAEQILKTTQPYRYAVWLGQNGRNDEKLPFLRAVAASNPDPHERAWAWRGIAREDSTIGAFGEMRDASLEAIRLAPKLSLAWEHLAAVELAQGHTEAAMAATRKSIALLRTDPDLEAWGRNGKIDEALVAELLGDHAAGLARVRELLGADPRAVANNSSIFTASEAKYLGLLHRIAEVRASLARGLPPAALLTDPATTASVSTIMRWRMLRAAEDWPGMVAMAAEPDLVGRARLFGATPKDQATSAPTIDLAQARLMTGDLAGAAAMLDPTPLDCDRCLIGRGQLAAARGDAAGADRWFAKAEAAMPTLPQAAFEWGRAKLARKDAAGAIALFKEAHRKGPHWAEPLAYWGEALLAQGNAKAAAGKFAQAASHAPQWGRLHLKWGQALAKAGKAAEASKHFATAAKLDLTPDERAELARVHGGR